MTCDMETLPVRFHDLIRRLCREAHRTESLATGSARGVYCHYVTVDQADELTLYHLLTDNPVVIDNQWRLMGISTLDRFGICVAPWTDAGCHGPALMPVDVVTGVIAALVAKSDPSRHLTES
jgi:hypothetical protein